MHKEYVVKEIERLKTYCEAKRYILEKSLEPYKKDLKSFRIKLARIEAKERGEPVGAIMKRDNKTIIKLRKKGMSMREIANALGCSTTPVQAALKEFQEKNK